MSHPLLSILLTCTLLVAPLTPVSAQSSNPFSLPVEEGFVTTPDGIRLFYQKIGSAPTVVILPGRLFTFEDFRRLGPHVTLISYDMRNRGRSDFVPDGSRLTMQADIDDLDAVRRHFRVSRFTAVGYSYLGFMIVLYALQFPQHIDRLVQIGPVPLKFDTEYPAHLTTPDPPQFTDPAERARVRKLREENFHLTNPQQYCEEEWKSSRFRLVGDPAKVTALSSRCEYPNEWPTNLVRHFTNHFVSIQKLDVPRESFARVTVPVLTIHGTLDRNAPYAAGREWALLLPNARLLTVPGAAHQCFAESPEIVFPAIEQFLKGNWPPAAEKITQLDPRAPSR